MLCRLNFGFSTLQQSPVAGLIWPRLGSTLLLTAYATVVSVVLAIPLAVLSALSRNRPLDHAIRLDDHGDLRHARVLARASC